jgi:membrane protease YdiL (CAAX protease family)
MVSLVERVVDPSRGQGGWTLVALAGVMGAAIALGVSLGREWGHFASAAAEVLPFAALAIFAYLGIQRGWARGIALAALALILGGSALVAIGVTVGAVFPAGVVSPEQGFKLPADAVRSIALVSGGVAASLLVASMGFIPAVRRFLARFLPLDPTSFVHTVALVAVVAITLTSVVPLLVLSQPPLLSDGWKEVLEGMSAQRSRAGQLVDALYGLVWLVPVAVIAVGFGIRRNLSESLQRLNFVRPSLRQVAVGLGVAVGLVVAMRVAGGGIEWLWQVLGWPTTDGKAVERLLGHFLSPVGAVVIGVVAGIGEELAVRGVLQPRLGLWLSNLAFTLAHAFQYNWDALLIVFAIGMVLGVLRQKTNTTVCAIVHGTYNFLLVMAVVYQIPWLSN